MRGRLLLLAPPTVVALVLGVGLVEEGAFSGWWEAEALGTARIMGALPRGTDVSGYRVVSVEPERTDHPSPDQHCGKVSAALTAQRRAPATSTRIVLVPDGWSGQGHSVVSHSFSEGDAKKVMGRIRAALPDCAHYNAWYADLYTRHGLRPTPSPYRVGDDTISYRRLDPPPGDKDAGGSPLPMPPGPLQEPGRTITLVRTGGVITQYPDTLPRAVVEDLADRFRRAGRD
ncbi:hypothetical protein ACFWUQ_02550 [Streptomyces sp. NPDC058662]|uniref:hypothetical protein n=1 Tax=Streptomyces sp. NPDC058662 TaxID=3346583 RepID=UPI003659E741